MTLRSIRAGCVILAGALVLMTFVSGAAADEGSGGAGITVTGEGKAVGLPSVVEIGATVSGQAELAADAIVKYRDTKRRATAAIDGLKNPSLSIESRGFTVSNALDANQQQMMMQGRTDITAKSKVLVSEGFKIIIKDANKLQPEALMELVLKVIDTGKDAGLQIGPPSPQNYYQAQIAMQSGQGMQLVTFKIPDATALRDQAYQKAIEEAKAKAQRLAGLAGVKLGRIISVSEAMPVKAGDSSMQMIMAMYGQATRPETSDLVSNVFGEITQTAKVTAQFEIEK